MTHRVAHNPYVHTAAAYYLLVESLNARPDHEPLLKAPMPAVNWSPKAFQPTDEERAAVQNIVQDAAGGRVGGRIVLLNPNASDLLPLRRWPTDRFVALGMRLLEEDADLLIGITGAPDERDAAERVAALIDPPATRNGRPPRAVCLAGRTTLRQLVVLYTFSDLLVTNDSGPGHFASLTDLPAIVLFGPETPDLYSPIGKATHVISARLACSPCVSAMNHRFSACTDNVCMREISVDRVYAIASELLRRARTPSLELTVLPSEPRLTPRLTTQVAVRLASGA